MERANSGAAARVRLEAEIAKAGVLVGYAVFAGASFPRELELSSVAKDHLVHARAAMGGQGRGEYRHAYSSHRKTENGWRVTVTGNRYLCGVAIAYCEIDAVIQFSAEGVPLIDELHFTNNEVGSRASA